ncbi:MAG: branched-chain amino acid ABC transporter permease [Burkholderiales bacterium]|jgi:branched-chain amino acid transport system permease protein|nr:branched-chain amino acid ABC transporter permease [Burkholderiales bacterium]MCA3229361.1 branched-chain amino acid ABC transporter permease [Burkholderiales bacterium]
MAAVTLPTLEYRPLNFGRWVVWGFAALMFLVLPFIFTSKFSLALMSQAGILIIFALSYNMLLGQSGMLSFGHAVYSGLGAYFAIHALNLVGKGQLAFPVSLLPLVGGLAGLLFGFIFGWLTTRKAGTPFAMITLGLGEMVFAASLMFPGFFGGEAGISGNRTAGPPFLGVPGWTFGPDIQVYYLIAVWCFACMVAMFALTHTPLGRIANAVRDNPERAEFIGYNTQRVRWLMLMLSAFFAGIAGGLMAINLESVGSEAVSAIRSGGVLLAAFIGGVSFFFGPILGAVVFIFFSIALSEYTKAWQLYLGAFFVILVMFAPGGLSSLILMNLRVMKFRKFGALLDPYFGVIVSGVALALGLALVVEMTYHLTLDIALGPQVRFFGFALDTQRLEAWVLAITLVGASFAAFEYTRRQFKAEWDRIQVEIEDWIRDNPED